MGTLRRDREDSAYRELFQATPTPLLLSTPRGRIRDANRSFLRWFGAGLPDLLGRTEEEVGLWEDPSTRAALLARATEADRGDAPATIEARLRTRVHGVRHTSVRVDVLRFAEETGVLFAIQDVTEEAARTEELARIALHDPLTGLPNRRLFLDRLEHALTRARRDGSGVAVLFLDLDRFKLVNDTYGHAAGDLVLKEAARRVRRCLREQDTVGRMGGDEFAVVLTEVERTQSVEEAVRRVVAALGRPVEVEGEPVITGGSVGAAITYAGAHSAEALLRFSDGAMYRAKRQGGGNYRIYDPSLDSPRGVTRLWPEAK